MATIRDKEAFEKAMKECIEHPYQLRWVGDISVSYSDNIDKFIATFDCDLVVIFDYVTYSSDSIFFYNRDVNYAVAYITHKGLHEDRKVEE